MLSEWLSQTHSCDVVFGVCICKLLNLSIYWFSCPRKKRRGKKFGEKSNWNGREFKKQSLATFWSECLTVQLTRPRWLWLSQWKKKKNLSRFTKNKNLFWSLFHQAWQRKISALLLSYQFPWKKVFLSCVRLWHLILVAFTRFTICSLKQDYYCLFLKRNTIFPLFYSRHSKPVA